MYACNSNIENFTFFSFSLFEKNVMVFVIRELHPPNNLLNRICSDKKKSKK